MLIQTDNINFSRDTESGALLNNNEGELLALKAQRNRINKQESEMLSLKSLVEELKQIIMSSGSK